MKQIMDDFKVVHKLKKEASMTMECRYQKGDFTNNHGPFDIIGDVHGCYEELKTLVFDRLGYDKNLNHPENRTIVFVGDLIDRGPFIAEVLDFLFHGVTKGKIIHCLGNHDNDLHKYFMRIPVDTTMLRTTLLQIQQHPDDTLFRRADYAITKAFLYATLDDGYLVVSHSGLPEEFFGVPINDDIYRHCLYGDIDGTRDEQGLMIRRDWTKEYSSHVLNVYGHTPVKKPYWNKNTVNIDTGCIFGGSLTALRYPEMETISVPAKKAYAESLRFIK